MPTIDRSVYHTWKQYQWVEGFPANPRVSGGTLKHPRTRTGQDNPKWREQVSKHENATTPLTAEFNKWRGMAGHHVADFLWNPTTGFGSGKAQEYIKGQLAAVCEMTLPTLNMFGSTADARARARAYSAIRGLQVKVSGPTFLGEMRQTLRQLRRPAGALGQKAWDHVNRAKKLRGKPGSESWNKALAESWLEYSFGWVPLLADIAGARDAYNSLADSERVERFSVGAEDKRRSIDSNTVTSIPPGSHLWQNKLVTQDDLHTVRYRGAVTARAATTCADRFARFGFTPSEFIPTAWELLPWSFLIDYFVNIDDLITAAVTDTSGLRWLNKTDRRHAVRRVTLVPNKATTDLAFPASAKVIQSRRPSMSVHERTSITRSVGVGLYPPELTFEIPSAERSPIKYLNIAALLNLARSVHPQRTKGRSYRL